MIKDGRRMMALLKPPISPIKVIKVYAVLSRSLNYSDNMNSMIRVGISSSLVFGTFSLSLVSIVK